MLSNERRNAPRKPTSIGFYRPLNYRRGKKSEEVEMKVPVQSGLKRLSIGKVGKEKDKES